MQLNFFKKRTVCQHCQCETDEPLFVTKHVGKSTMQFQFCGELCASLYYTDLLRKQGSDLVSTLRRAGI